MARRLAGGVSAGMAHPALRMKPGTPAKTSRSSLVRASTRAGVPRARTALGSILPMNAALPLQGVTRGADIGLVVELEGVGAGRHHPLEDPGRIAADVEAVRKAQGVGRVDEPPFVGPGEFRVHGRRDEVRAGRAVAVRDHVGPRPGHEPDERGRGVGAIGKEGVGGLAVPLVDEVHHPIGRAAHHRGQREAGLVAIAADEDLVAEVGLEPAHGLEPNLDARVAPDIRRRKVLDLGQAARSSPRPSAPAGPRDDRPRRPGPRPP